MISAHNQVVDRVERVAPSHRSLIGVADILLPTSLGLWAFGISHTNVSSLGSYGLLPLLPLTVYLGVALLVLSAAIELTRDRPPSRWRMSAHSVGLVIMLYAIAPVVYSQARYSWLYKTIGVVQYVNQHGHLDNQIDIYQNWPGFFALAAWFGKVAGVASPLSYAKWAQLVFELAALPILYSAYQAVSLSLRQRWLALMLYPAANWIGQDYYSPQALGTLLSLGILALVLRWLHMGNRARFVDERPSMGKANQLKKSKDASTASRQRIWQKIATRGPISSMPGRHERAQANDQSSSFQASTTRIAPSRSLIANKKSAATYVGVVVLVYFVLTFTHELSPYILAIQIGALAAVRLLRPRLLAFLLAAIAIGYLLPRFSYVNSHYGLLSSVGSFFRNVRPPHATGGGPIPESQKIIYDCSNLLSAIMWAAALVGIWMRRKSGRTALALGILAYSPGLILVLQAYGNEGVLRVYLFSLPWTAALVASALIPYSGLEDFGQRRQSATFDEHGRFRRPGGAARIAGALGIVVALFFPSFFGGDKADVMSQSEVGTVTNFMNSAPAGPVLLAIDNSPISDTERYNLFPLQSIFGSDGALGSRPVTSNIAEELAQYAVAYTRGLRPSYVLVTPSMIAVNQAEPVTQPGSFRTLLSSLARSHWWRLLVDKNGTVIYEIPPGHLAIPAPAKSAPVPVFGLP